MLSQSQRITPGILLKGRYEIISCIGYGGMGSVYRAIDRVGNTEVAVKEVSSALLTAPGARQRFEDEISVQSKIIHPNVARAVDYVNEEAGQALIIEYVDGGDLASRMGRGRLPIDEVVEILSQVASGLEAIHAHNVVHRDLKPENILLTGRGVVKITDFGVAGLGREQTLTRAGHLVGTVKYVAPEFIETGECDSRGDLFALGVIAFELVTGVSPFKSGDLRGLMLERFKTTAREDLALLAPDCPNEIARIVTKLMSLSVGQRYQTATEVLADLHRFESEFFAPRGAAPALELQPVVCDIVFKIAPWRNFVRYSAAILALIALLMIAYTALVA